MPYDKRDGAIYRRHKERLRRTADVCHICGGVIDKTLKWPHPKSFSVDHILPYSLNPELRIARDNLAGVHLGCNSSKGNRSATDDRPSSRDW
jgi:5-methylcytosine-specific restriction endonuclease McrA